MSHATPCNPAGRFFALTPDPEIYFPVTGHSAVWRALRHAVMHSDGTILLTGEPGTGKTMLLLRLQAVGFETCEMVSLVDIHQESHLFILRILLALDPAWRGEEQLVSPLDLFPLLEQRASQGRRLLLAVDDAHLLTQKNLETLAALQQFSLDGLYPIQLLLVGRPETSELLQEKSLQPLLDSLSATLVLPPLLPREVVAYVKHFLGANKEKPLRITWWGWLELLSRSQGLPRRINRLLRQSIGTEGDCVITGKRIRQVCPLGQFRLFPWEAILLLPWFMVSLVVLFVLGFAAGRLTMEPPAVTAQVIQDTPATVVATIAPPQPPPLVVVSDPPPQPPPLVVVSDPPPPPPLLAMDETIEEAAPVLQPAPPFPPPLVTKKIAKRPDRWEAITSERPVRPKGVVYTVQIGSFSRRDNADKILNQLVRKGYPAYLQNVERGGRSLFSIRVDYSAQRLAEKASHDIEAAVNLSVLVLKNTFP